AVDSLYDRLAEGADPLTVNPGSTVYDWAAMPLNPSHPPDYGALEVAELMYHVGVTINNVWGVFGTCSNHESQAEALRDHFRYYDGAIHIPLDVDAMVSEMKFLRPIGISGGDDDGGGHAWLTHGYDTNYSPYRFLMNMGWNGNGDGWHTLDDFPGEFYNDMGNLIYVAPTRVYFVGGYGGDGSPTSPYGNLTEALNGTPDHSTLIFKAADTYTFYTEDLVIDRPLTLKGIDVTIEKF
ncbi:MAG: hypothetical protein GF355_13380, partial [Candidatus Eisenbacteria bacterium]|nr:hypothetical protein [Candidatus Eisenbacteria bacterium]